MYKRQIICMCFINVYAICFIQVFLCRDQKPTHIPPIPGGPMPIPGGPPIPPIPGIPPKPPG